MRTLNHAPLMLRPSSLPLSTEVVEVRVPDRVRWVCCTNDGGRPLLFYPDGAKGNAVLIETGAIVALGGGAQSFGLASLPDFDVITLADLGSDALLFDEDPIPEFVGLTEEAALRWAPPAKVARQFFVERFASIAAGQPVQISRRAGTFKFTLSSDPTGNAIYVSNDASEAAKAGAAGAQNHALQPGEAMDWFGALNVFALAGDYVEVLQHNIPLVKGAK